MLPIDPITGEIKRYIGYRDEFRKVTSDCLISYGGNRYFVPHYFARNEVWVRVSKGVYLHIYSQKNVLIAVHTLSSGKGEVIINEEHYKGYRADIHRVTFDMSAQKLLECLKRNNAPPCDKVVNIAHPDPHLLTHQ